MFITLLATGIKNIFLLICLGWQLSVRFSGKEEIFFFHEELSPRNGLSLEQTEKTRVVDRCVDGYMDRRVRGFIGS